MTEHDAIRTQFEQDKDVRVLPHTELDRHLVTHNWRPR